MQESSVSNRRQPSRLTVAVNLQGRISVRVEPWAGCLVEDLLPAVRFDGVDREPAAAPARETDANGTTLTYDLSPLRLQLRCETLGPSAVMLAGSLVNDGDKDVLLDDVALLRSPPGRSTIRFGGNPGRVLLLEQGNYWGRVRPLAYSQGSAAATAAGGVEPAGVAVQPGRSSDLVWVAYDRDARQALLVGFLSSERWLGRGGPPRTVSA